MTSQTTSVTDAQTPAGWYQDPAGVGELRWFDGTQWTEHVTIDGAQTTAPLQSSTPTPTPSFTMRRTAQWRTEDEKPLEVVTPRGVLGRFVPMLDGAPGYRFDDADGQVVVSVSKPGLKSSVDVRDPNGALLGTITKIGRLHSRYEVTAVDTGAASSVRLAAGASDEWELQTDRGIAATFVRDIRSVADALNFADVEYTASTAGALDDRTEQLYLAIPLAIDILDTQIV